jgi:hypothetical protein
VPFSDEARHLIFPFGQERNFGQARVVKRFGEMLEVLAVGPSNMQNPVQCKKSYKSILAYLPNDSVKTAFWQIGGRARSSEITLPRSGPLQSRAAKCRICRAACGRPIRRKPGEPGSARSFPHVHCAFLRRGQN